MKLDKCRVTDQGRICGRPAVGTFDVPDKGRVPVCAKHKAAIDARIKTHIRAWAAQLASGTSVDDLRMPGEE